MDYGARLDRLRRAMAEQGIALLAVPPGDDLRYLTGFSPLADERPCYLFLNDRAGLFLVPELNAHQSEGHIRQPFVTYTDAEGPEKALYAVRGQFRAPRTIAVGDTMRADALLHLQRIWPEASYLPASTVLAPLRMRKSAEEIEALRQAARTADAAMEAACAASRPGITEAEVAHAAGEGFRRAGADEVTFTTVASGPNSAFPHHHTGPRALRSGEPVLYDLGSRHQGYCSDITRMAYLGEPSPRYREIHRIVEDAVRAALEVIRPGTPIREVDLAARRVIERAGYGRFFTHRTGHGIGLSGHEPPSVTHTNEMPLEAGMAFSVEPGIYLPGEFGVRLEEIVIVTERGPVVLSALPRDLRVIAP
ncbi:MAG: Xaa-Pro peptidase family protein [Armatimonadota bacterium]|nr:Xaa-Pro peptidase family protein [Armatimonadota bacterium]MDR7450700.1 Xaa-Pro peptidase family protein [Armatimonadota bacterium]MDR7466056.1 Xaa-Pro peptidase family protein [Armatimonadota bacterium]MDR7493907.1 Xaa-Pro peptidase family protein [Armatimonadota bacterium]MDR7504012.1 Xaa-Pro peptidase family protein [Armatimonadota bacterium]